VLDAESTMVSDTSIPVSDIEDARKVLRIMDMLEDNDDVQDVYSNFDIAEEIMAEMDQ
jgi:transcriptional/translational regulatory protein YebC/TACO1